MNSSLIDMLPPELQTIPVLTAGVLALIGLILWSAGIKVARVMLSVFLGAVAAAVAIWVLPTLAGLAVLSSGLIGVAVGVFLGAIAFRALQGAVLAACLAIAVSGGYYHWQIHKNPPPAPKTTLPAKDLQADLTQFPATPDDARKVTTDTGIHATIGSVVSSTKSWWQSIPAMLRQSMIALAGGASIIAIAIAWMAPRYTTWVLTAALGTALLLIGGQTLLHVYAPQYQHWLPTQDSSLPNRLGVLLIACLIGMLTQRLLFWPGRRQKKDRQQDHSAQPATA